MLEKSASLSCSFDLFGLSGLSSFWLNETNQTNQINQINKTNQMNQRDQTDRACPRHADHWISGEPSLFFLSLLEFANSA
jgi:hypothetical protein